MSKRINIYISSSGENLKSETEELRNFIDRLGDDLVDSYDVVISSLPLDGDGFREKIRIFIGSSITEFEEERSKLERFIHQLRNILVGNSIGLWPDPENCEAEDTAMSPTRKQDDFNQLI